MKTANTKTSAKTSSQKSNTVKQARTAQPATDPSSTPTREERPARPVCTLKTFQALTAAAQWRGVFVTGPQPFKPTPDAEEIPTWNVSIVDEDHNPVSRVYQCHSYERAERLAVVMATDRKIELVNEATPA